LTTTLAGFKRAQAFVPPLPPADLDVDGLDRRLDQANQAIDRLEGITVLLPDRVTTTAQEAAETAM